MNPMQEILLGFGAKSLWVAHTRTVPTDGDECNLDGVGLAGGLYKLQCDGSEVAGPNILPRYRINRIGSKKSQVRTLSLSPLD